MIERSASGALPGHGEALPSDGDLDVCTCARCRALDAQPASAPRRGPPDDASGRHCRIDVVSRLAIEGRRPDLTLIRADQACDRGRK